MEPVKSYIDSSIDINNPSLEDKRIDHITKTWLQIKKNLAATLEKKNVDISIEKLKATPEWQAQEKTNRALEKAWSELETAWATKETAWTVWENARKEDKKAQASLELTPEKKAFDKAIEAYKETVEYKAYTKAKETWLQFEIELESINKNKSLRR